MKATNMKKSFCYSLNKEIENIKNVLMIRGQGIVTNVIQIITYLMRATFLEAKGKRLA